MRIFENLDEYSAAVGEELGVSDWYEVDQERVNMFADATGDHQWIHLDPERTQKELGMGTIAHGFLTLSLLPVLMGQISGVK
ncbi:MAG: MaoC/PaaZ C-terminal domain-containing protein, partial [Parvibaculales bacterium]